MNLRRELDEVLDDLFARCMCDACERYRKSFAARAAVWAVKIEESLGARSNPGGLASKPASTKA